MMGASLSYDEFASCSSSTSAAKTSFPYQPSCISSSTPSLRIASAPPSMRSGQEKASTPPPPSPASPSPSPLPRHTPPPPPPKPFLNRSYDRSAKASSESTKNPTVSKPIGIEQRKSLDAGEMTLSCPSMLMTSPTSNNSSSGCHVVNANVTSASSSSSKATHGHSPFVLENGISSSSSPPTHIHAPLPLPLPLPLPPPPAPPRPSSLSSSKEEEEEEEEEEALCCRCRSSAREIDLLRNETRILRSELTDSRKTISLMKDKEKVLRHRLSEQARRQLERGSTKFEDISLGENRPSQLIRRYGNLYSEGRLEAMEALDELQEVSEFTDLKEKLLLSVIVLAFRNAKRHLEEMKSQMRRLLCISDLPTAAAAAAAAAPSVGHESSLVQRSRPLPPLHPAVTELESVISVFLRKTVDQQNLSKICQEVRERVWSTLFDFPKLRFCRGLQRYVEDCVRLAWSLSIQNPPFVVDYKARVFSPETHTRFHTSNADSDQIKSFLWPTLREGSETGPCVHKGFVVT